MHVAAEAIGLTHYEIHQAPCRRDLLFVRSAEQRPYRVYRSRLCSLASASLGCYFCKLRRAAKAAAPRDRSDEGSFALQWGLPVTPHKAASHPSCKGWDWCGASSKALSCVHCVLLFEPTAFCFPKSASGLCEATSIVRTIAGSTWPASRNRDKW